jgi:hypothetical protein
MMSIRSHHLINYTAGGQMEASPVVPVAAGILPPSRGQFSQQTSLVRSALEKLGFYRRRTMRYYQTGGKDTKKFDRTSRKQFISEIDELSILWTMIGLGLTLTCRSYGRILPSLSTYSVVDKFSAKTDDLIYQGSVDDLHKIILSGALHLSLQNANGESLLYERFLFHCTNLLPPLI